MNFSSTVSQKFNGFLLVQYLSGRFTYLLEAEWRRQLVTGRIEINGQLCLGDVPIWSGDTVSFTPDMSEFPEPAADLNIQILYQDKWIICVNKTGNLLVHHQGRSLTHNLIYQLRYGVGPPYPSACLVHRLDRETSGVILVARHVDYVGRLSALFAQQEVEKTYLAVVYGRPKQECGIVDSPIGRDPDSVVTYRYTADNRAVKAKNALTRYQVLGTRGDVTLVRVFPKTGRTHQIRVHLAHLGHPIVGDKLYGRTDAEFVEWRSRPWSDQVGIGIPSPRQALHAESLYFVHPWTGEPVRLEAPIPKDMGAWGLEK
ncbi:MAG: RluA family pseudouridine synthase [Proteobacteria bacterium]|nr:RluA family pseudouridine synthase [Desulfobulbaceae bacterium]MBU4152865.1 RluA family pseudouridine synthase [Pseudomonadota bacterium]